MSMLRRLFAARTAQIRAQAKVNRIHGFRGPEKTDGVVGSVHDGYAYVEWPNGDRSLESVSDLVPIVD
jgi:hypothetical protein